MTDLATVDFFSDPAIAQDPYAYFDALREQNPVFREPHQGVDRGPPPRVPNPRAHGGDGSARA